jgi:hypothetical protein
MVRDSYVRECLQRMREWMEMRGLKPVTISIYLGCIRGDSEFKRRFPPTCTDRLHG